MKGKKRSFFIGLFLLTFLVSICSSSWAWEKWPKYDPNTDQWNTADLFLARPMGLGATGIGVLIFVPSLVFTIPVDAFGIRKGAIKESAKIFIVNPVKFTFREFPDGDM